MSLRVLLVVLPIALGQQLSQCDPIQPEKCYLPIPNDFWLRDGPKGRRVTMDKTTFPADLLGNRLDPEAAGYNDLDGWAPFVPIVTFFPDLDLKTSGIVPYWNISESLNVDRSPTLLLDANTGKPIPHFAELDESAGPNQTRKALLIVPAYVLDWQTRYIVALRGLRDATGHLLPTSKGFAALRDGTPTEDFDIESRRAMYRDDVFAPISKAGWAQSSLQLAWTFTTGSRDGVVSRLVHVRDDAVARVNQNGGITYHIDTVTEAPRAGIARQIEGHLDIPQYVNSPLPGATLVLDQNGVPQFTGMGRHDFLVIVPESLANGSRTDAKLLYYGHGLFGSREEAKTGYLGDYANKYGYVVMAGDWLGMSEADVPSVVLMLATNITMFKMIPDRLTQGMLGAHMITKAIGLEEKFSTDPAMTFNGRRILNKPDIYYYGNSNGGQMGSVYMASSLWVQRGCLGVGGAPYSILLPRSRDFAALGFLLKLKYSDPVDKITLLSAMQLLWQRLDPTGYLTSLTSNPLPGIEKPKEILMQHALGDQQVSQVGLWIAGRSLGAKMFVSNVHEQNDLRFGFPYLNDNEVAQSPVQATWRFQGVLPIPTTNVPPEQGADTHEGPRRNAAAQLQLHRFLTTGDIINTCGGPCDANM